MEKALLVGVKLKNENIPLDESLSELQQLAKTSGARTIGTITQNREFPDPRYFLGKGKLNEVTRFCVENAPDLVIIDHEVSSTQIRNLEDSLGVKVIDRTELILDIFAQHAHTREGSLQVELAQSEFLLTRLTGHGVSLSRLGGGIGTRGPGETKLEMDRRRIRKKISELKDELASVARNRHLLREKRRSSRMSVGAIVGYTNAGKSTLLNSMARAGVKAEDMLFATLDPVTKRTYIQGGGVILLTDTVGFIQKLPHQLVEAFKATLEEVNEADFLLHVVDSSSPYMEDQIASVYKVLEEIGAISKPIITVFNKIDLVKPPKNYLKKFSPAVFISAETREGLDKLAGTILKLLAPPA
ncbi:MAG TPA: GTPase HflX [Candidatus Omnitrophota bacterium]|nr:GTPase HflX [Candidatus Omnitrophota bacterium]